MSTRNPKSSRRTRQPVAVEIGDRIRTARLRRGLLALELAQKVGISAPHLSNLENGRVEARVATLLGLAAAIGCPLAELLPTAATRAQLLARVNALPDASLPALEQVLSLLERR